MHLEAYDNFLNDFDRLGCSFYNIGKFEEAKKLFSIFPLT